MKLSHHLLIHFLCSLVIGIVFYYFSRNIFTIPSAIIGGFFIDIDHFIDYYLAFGFKFNLQYFCKGYQFLKLDKIYIFFHSFELALILSVLSIFKIFNSSQSVILWWYIIASFSLSLLIHLILDVFIDHLPIKSYFITYRFSVHFNLQDLVSKEHYKFHKDIKNKVKF